MKAILAHWKKDLLSVRSLLLVWLLCVGVLVAFGIGRVVSPDLVLSLLHSNSNNMAGTIAVFFAFITGIVGGMGLQFLLLAILIVRIVQLDPLVDPDAWWRTRPISGLGLLAAKALSVGMLLLGALLCLGAMGFGNVAWVSPCLSALVFVVGVVAFASLTKGLSSLILNWLALAVGSAVLGSIVLALWKHSFSVVQGPTITLAPHVNAAVDATAASPLLSLLYLAGFLAAIFCQYLIRSANLSRAILFATFFLVFLVKR